MSNLNSTECETEYREAFLKSYVKVLGRNKRITSSSVAGWITELKENKVTIKSIEAAANRLSADKVQNSKYITDSDFITTAILIEKNTPDCNSHEVQAPYRNKFNAFCEKMRFVYKGLWFDYDGLDRAEFNFWVSELISAEISASLFDKVFDQIRSLDEFRKFPPNIDQLIDIARVCSLDEQIPSPAEAYKQAISCGDCHKLVRHARKIYGYHELRSQSSAVSKPNFEKLYREIVRKYASGELYVPNEIFNKDNLVPVPSTTIVSTLDSLIAKYS